MVTMEKNSDTIVIQIKLIGGGEHLSRLQRAVLLGIETIGSHKELSGDDDFREAIGALSELSRQMMLSESQNNIGLGSYAYNRTEKAKVV